MRNLQRRYVQRISPMSQPIDVYEYEKVEKGAGSKKPASAVAVKEDAA
jgi:hypothetical protein